VEGIQVVQAGAEVNHAFGNEGFTALYDIAPAAYELPHRRLTRKRFTDHQPPLHLLGAHTSVPPYALAAHLAAPRRLHDRSAPKTHSPSHQGLACEATSLSQIHFLSSPVPVQHTSVLRCFHVALESTFVASRCEDAPQVV